MRDERNFLQPGTFLFKAEPVDQYGNLIDRHNLWEMVGVRFRRARRLAAVEPPEPSGLATMGVLRGYLAWKRGDETAARKFLEQARAALGPDWQPEGATSEGDVQRKQHVEPTPLAACWERWNGQFALTPSFAALEDRLSRAP